MVKSMTGYGRAEESVNGCTITVELRSVNNRYLDCNVRIPRLYLFAEDAIKARVQNTISRGKVDVFVTLDNAGADKVQVSVNKPVADGYYAALKSLAEEYHLSDDISVSLLSRFPEVLLAEKAEDQTRRQSGKKASGGHLGGSLRVLAAQLPGDEVAASVAEEEAHGLNHGHHGEDHAHRTGGGVAFQQTHEEGVRHIVKRGDQHTDDAGDRHAADGAAHGGFRQFLELFRLFFVHAVPTPSSSLFIPSIALREGKQKPFPMEFPS